MATCVWPGRTQRNSDIVIKFLKFKMLETKNKFCGSFQFSPFEGDRVSMGHAC